MPNHIHLLVRQVKDDGITRFMRKFGSGYANYFNKKYNRKGYLFQGRFVAVRIKTNEQLKIVFVYIHSNPVSLIEPKWKEKGIINPGRAVKFLESYKWSSYQDYIGKKNFPSVTKRDFILKAMEGKQSCGRFVKYWLRHKAKIKEFSELALESFSES